MSEPSAAADAACQPEQCWSPTRWFWIFVLAHIGLWSLATWLMMPNVTLDLAEQVYWGHEWQWGYYKHPPLPAWVAEACYVVAGNSVLALFIAARVCTAVAFWGVWSLARRLVSERAALLATVALEANYYFTYEAHDLNNNTVARPFLVLAVLCLYLALFEKRFWAWPATGACLGLGMLCKYDTGLFALVMLAYSACDPFARKAWRTPGPYLLLVTSLVVFSPHVTWLIAHDFQPFQYLVKASLREKAALVSQHSLVAHVWFPTQFVLGHLLLLGPLLAVCASALKRPGQRKLAAESREQRRFLSVMALGPAVGYLLVSALTGIELSIGWGHHLGTWLPLLMFTLWEPSDSAAVIAPRLRWCLVAGLVLMGAGMGRSYAHPYLQHAGLARHFPGQELTQKIETLWREHGSGPLPIVVGNGWLAGNIALYSRQRPQVYCEWNSQFSPWLNDELLRTRGGVIVWEAGSPDDERVAEAVQRFPDIRQLPPLAASWRTGAKLKACEIQVAIIRPRTGAAEVAADVSSPGTIKR